MVQTAPFRAVFLRLLQFSSFVSLFVTNAASVWRQTESSRLSSSSLPPNLLKRSQTAAGSGRSIIVSRSPELRLFHTPLLGASMDAGGCLPELPGIIKRPRITRGVWWRKREMFCHLLHCSLASCSSASSNHSASCAAESRRPERNSVNVPVGWRRQMRCDETLC